MNCIYCYSNCEKEKDNDWWNCSECSTEEFGLSFHKNISEIDMVCFYGGNQRRGAWSLSILPEVEKIKFMLLKDYEGVTKLNFHFSSENFISPINILNKIEIYKTYL